MTEFIDRVLFIAHDNEGSRHILRTLVEDHPHLEFLVMQTTGLYYRKSILHSLWKLLRESSFLFGVNRMIDLGLGRMKRNLSLSRYCRELDITLHKTLDINNEDSIKIMQGFNPDIIAVTFTMHIISEQVIRQAKIATLGVHPSLIPEYRGLEVFFWMMANGESEGGTSVFLLTPEVDIGHVLETERWPILATDTVSDVYGRLTKSCANSLSRTIARNDIHKIQDPRPAKADEGSYFPMPTREAYSRFKKRGYRWR